MQSMQFIILISLFLYEPTRYNVLHN